MPTVVYRRISPTVGRIRLRRLPLLRNSARYSSAILRRHLNSREKRIAIAGRHSVTAARHPGTAPGDRVVPGSLPDERITDLAEHEGRVWITTQSGLAVLAEGRRHPELAPVALRDRYLTTLQAVDRGSVWVGSNENDLFRFRPGESSDHVTPLRPFAITGLTWGVVDILIHS